MRECQECGREMAIYRFYEDTIICEHCHIKKDPPKMKLAVLQHAVGTPLFNVTLRVYETRRTIEDFKKCGWFVRQIRETRGFTYYDLEYFGKKKCARCTSSKIIFPANYPMCPDASKCTGQTVFSMCSERYIG